MNPQAPWVGRAAELAALEGAYEQLRAGQGGAWLISGEPGIGKSRLLAESGRRVAASGAQVFEGQAAELERDFPFGVLVDALDPYLASLDSGTWRSLTGAQRRLLGLIFPALAAGAVDRPLIAQERFLCYRAVGELLGVLAARRPLVLLLDDVHWADEGSLELLDHLLRRPPAGRVLLALAHRAGWSRAQGWPASGRLELGPLSPEQADALLGASLPAGARARVYLESGGNPFFLEHLAWAEGRRTHKGEGPPTSEMLDLEVPAPVRAALARELTEIGDPLRRVLQGAAVAGDPFSPELAAVVADADPAGVRAALDRAIALGLVGTTETPALFRFRHPIVRRAIYASAGAAWRTGAHARAEGELARRGSGPVARAHHVEYSAVRGDEEAVAVLRAAGEAAAAVAPASAARWFLAALRLLPEGDPARRLELLGPLASALGSAGRLEESRAILLEILHALPPDLVAPRVRLIGFMALIDRLLGRQGEARQLLEHTLRSLSADAVDAGAISLELAADRFFAGDWPAMLEHAERGRRIAAGEGGAGLRASAASLVGLAEYSLGRVAAGRARREEALELLDVPGADARGLRLDALDWLGWLELSIEEYDAAREHFTRGLTIGRRGGGGHLLTTMSFGLVLTCTWSGCLVEATKHSDVTLSLGRLSGSEQVLAWAHGLRCLCELRCGALASALRHGEQATQLSRRGYGGPFTAVNGGWYGETLVEAGQPARGRDQILRSLGGAELPAIESAYRPYFYDVLTAAEVALGRGEPAARWADAARRTAAGLGLPGRDGAALHASALTEPDLRRSTALALDAAAALAVAHPIEAARARTLAGRQVGAAGERDAALQILQRASAELIALGAGHLAAQAIRERRHLGERLGRSGRRGGAHGGPGGGLGSLSDREREVADLVQDRLTNRQIADRLVLSEKTVERHLSRIFAKLEVRSRVEVARAVGAERHETLQP